MVVIYNDDEDATSSGFDPFKVFFKDLEKGVNSLKLAGGTEGINAFSGTNLIPINDDLFFNNGAYAKFEFKQYDIQSDISYSIDINPNGVSAPNDYGEYFTIDNTKPIRFLPTSKMTLATKGALFNDSDVIRLTLAYDGTNNLITMADDNEYKQKNNAPSWKTKKLLQALEETPTELYLSVPITRLNSKNISKEKRKNSDGDDVEYISGTNVLYNLTIAKPVIRITEKEITFDPGLDDPKATETVVPDETKKIIKEIKFDGEGLKSLQDSKYEYSGISKEQNLERFIVGITNFILSFVAAIAVLMLIYGGYLWIVDSGDDQMSEKAKKIIAGSVIGIIIIVSAYTIVNTVIKLEGNTYDGCGSGFQIGNGTDFNLNCNVDNILQGGGLGGLIGGGFNTPDGGGGGIVGGLLGGGDGGIGGGLLGGGDGGIGGGLFGGG
jgi:hypothetical protein